MYRVNLKYSVLLFLVASGKRTKAANYFLRYVGTTLVTICIIYFITHFPVITNDSNCKRMITQLCRSASWPPNFRLAGVIFKLKCFVHLINQIWTVAEFESKRVCYWDGLMFWSERGLKYSKSAFLTMTNICRYFLGTLVKATVFNFRLYLFFLWSLDYKKLLFMRLKFLNPFKKIGSTPKTSLWERVIKLANFVYFGIIGQKTTFFKQNVSILNL